VAHQALGAVPNSIALLAGGPLLQVLGVGALAQDALVGLAGLVPGRRQLGLEASDPIGGRLRRIDGPRRALGGCRRSVVGSLVLALVWHVVVRAEEFLPGRRRGS